MYQEQASIVWFCPLNLLAVSRFHSNKFDSLSKMKQGKIESKGINPGLIVLLVIGGLLVTFLVGNFVMYTYAQKNLPPKKKKPLSKKKMMKQKQKQGVQVPGE
ncbi:unnamed protein product [Cochlearia groenlandica]